MKKKLILLSVLLSFVFGIVTISNAAKRMYTREQISENVYLLKSTIGTINLLLFYGKEGSLLVDTGTTDISDDLYSIVMEITGGNLKYIINTHAHDDHVQGNIKFSNDTVIIAHENAARNYDKAYFSLPLVKSNRKPDITFSSQMILYLNGEKIILEHTPPGHTNGDITVCFSGKKIVYSADLIFPDRFPSADWKIGGDPNGFLDVLGLLTDKFPEDVLFVSTHGRVYKRQEVINYRESLAKSEESIKNAMNQGYNMETILKGVFMEDHKDWINTSPGGFSQWVESVVRKNDPEKKYYVESINLSLTAIYIKKGIDETIKEYYRIQKDEPDSYFSDARQLNILGYHLLERGFTQDAIKIFTLNTKEHPESGYVFDSLAEAYYTNGQCETAIKFYEKSLSLNPANKNAKVMLEKLKNSK